MLFSGVIPLFFTMFSLTGVTDQGSCGSCVAHAVTACWGYAGYSMSGVWSWLVERGASCESGTRTSQLDGYLIDNNINFTKILWRQELIVNSLTAWSPVLASLSWLSFESSYSRIIIVTRTKFVDKSKTIWKTKKIPTYKEFIYNNFTMPFRKSGTSNHAVCFVWYTASSAVFQNSYGTAYGERGFGIVKREDIDGEFWSFKKVK